MPPIAVLLAAATPAPVLMPTGPWAVRAEASMCLLERSYLANGQRVSLVFQPMLDLPQMEVFVIGEDRRSQQQVIGTYTARVEPGARSFSDRYSSAYAPAAHRRVTRLQVRRELLDGLAEGDTLSIDAAPVSARFAIPGPDKARIALQGCIDELKREWGIGPAPAVPPLLKGDPSRFFSADSYPTEAVRAGVIGRVLVLLTITPAGTVGSCRVLSSAAPSLNAGTCRAAARLPFSPARDASGQPVAATYALPVRWLLPESD